MNLACFIQAAGIEGKDLLVLKGNGERVTVDVFDKALQGRHTQRYTQMIKHIATQQLREIRRLQF